MGTQIPKPDVFVEQVFTEEQATLPTPGLPACIVGINRQIVYQEDAGEYDGSSQSYSYPLLKSGAVIDTDSVLVFLDTVYGTFQVDSSDFTADDDSVDIEANVYIEREVVDTSTTGISSAVNNYETIESGNGVTTASSLSFSDATATFQTDGVVPGQRLSIMGTGSDAGVYTISSVDSETGLTVKATPWSGFTAFTGDAGLDYRVGADYSVFGDNSADFLDDGVVEGMYVRISSANNAGDYRIDKVVSDTQLNIDMAALESVETGETTAATADFEDSSVDLSQFSEGDVVVIESGADAGQYEIEEVVSSDKVTLDTTLSATATGVKYRIDKKLVVSSAQSYKIVDKSNEMTGSALICYKAVRSDTVGSLITINNSDEITTKLGLIHPENPVAYGAFLAAQITDKPFFVTAVTADTSEAHSTAASFLETKDIWGLAILSQDTEVNQLWAAHVASQSGFYEKHERVCFINSYLYTKTERMDGADGATDSTGLVFTSATGGFNDNGVIAGDYVVLADERARILRVDSDTQVTLVSPGLTASQSGLSFDIESKALDKTEQAQWVAAYSSAFASRRVYHIWPPSYNSDYTDWDGTVIDSAELDGYFYCAQAVAQAQQFYPQTPHTNQPLVDTRSLNYSNEYFTPTQLNIMAGGGTYIIAQDEEDTAPYCRMQCSTDVSTIEKRELSITKAVDHTAKFMRTVLRRFIGKNNITPQFLKQITMIADTVIARQVDDKVLLQNSKVTRVEQDENQADQVIIEVELDVPYPVNYIKVKLVI
mgnify:CR=1 FL=1